MVEESYFLHNSNSSQLSFTLSASPPFSLATVDPGTRQDTSNLTIVLLPKKTLQVGLVQVYVHIYLHNIRMYMHAHLIQFTYSFIHTVLVRYTYVHAQYTYICMYIRKHVFIHSKYVHRIWRVYNGVCIWRFWFFVCSCVLHEPTYIRTYVSR